MPLRHRSRATAGAQGSRVASAATSASSACARARSVVAARQYSSRVRWAAASGEPERLDPAPPRLASWRANGTAEPLPEEELAEPLLGTAGLAHHRLPAADQLPGGLLRRGRDAETREFPRAVQAHEFLGVPPVGLDPLARAPGREARGNHPAGGGAAPRQPVAAGGRSPRDSLRSRRRPGRG